MELLRDWSGEASVGPSNNRFYLSRENFTLHKTKALRFIIGGLILVLGFIAQANATPIAVSYNTGGFQATFQGDNFYLSGYSSPPLLPLNTTLPTDYVIGGETFYVGSRPGTSAGETISMYFDLSVDGVSEFISQVAYWNLQSGVDVFETASSFPVLFVTPAGKWDVTVYPNILQGTAGETITGDLRATFTPVPVTPNPTPEPASAILFGAGLLGIMVMLRKGLLA